MDGLAARRPGRSGPRPAVAAIDSTIVDVPTVRQHKLSQTSVTAQSYVIVQLRLANGVEGIGEAATLGGPRWSEESVEAIKANIDAYLAPALIGRPPTGSRQRARDGRRRQAQQRRQGRHRTALFDAVGKTLGLPASTLLGGAVRDRIPVLWTLASGDPVQEVEEAERKLEARLHRTFKVKIGALEPDADMARMRRLARGAGGPGETDRGCQPGLGRDRRRPLPAAAGRDGRRAWWSSRCRPGTCPRWPGCAPARHPAAAGRRMRVRRA